MKASQIVEAVLFASDAPLKAEEIARADESLDEDRVEEAIRELNTLYDETERAFQVVELGEGYQILTRSEFAPYLERFDTVPRPSRLSGPALETLAIIAYRQPIGRIEVEYIRGVNSAGVIRTLQDRDLIDVVGRAEGLGRPLLYGTTQRFLEHFGFASLDELPRPEELPVILRDRSPLEEILEGEGAGGDGASGEKEEGQGELTLDGDGKEAEAEPGPEEESQAEPRREVAVEPAAEEEPEAEPGPEGSVEPAAEEEPEAEPGAEEESQAEPRPEVAVEPAAKEEPEEEHEPEEGPGV